MHQNRDAPVRRHVNIDERILRAFENNAGNSTRLVADELGVSQTTVCHVLHENGLHPYHFQRVQQLLPRDEIQRIYFCEGIFIPFFYFFLFLWRF